MGGKDGVLGRGQVRFPCPAGPWGVAAADVTSGAPPLSLHLHGFPSLWSGVQPCHVLACLQRRRIALIHHAVLQKNKQSPLVTYLEDTATSSSLFSEDLVLLQSYRKKELKMYYFVNAGVCSTNCAVLCSSESTEHVFMLRGQETIFKIGKCNY